MQIRCNRAVNAVCARLKGELDHHSSKDARDTIESAIRSSKVRELVIDLGQVTFMDSAGIGVIIGRYRTMKARDGVIRIVNVAPHIEKLLKMSGLSGIIAN